jgi:hypothetical protein
MGLLNYWVSVLGEFQALSEKENGEWGMGLLNYWVSVLGEFQALSEKENGEWRMENEAAAQQFPILHSPFSILFYAGGALRKAKVSAVW